MRASMAAARSKPSLARVIRERDRCAGSVAEAVGAVATLVAADDVAPDAASDADDVDKVGEASLGSSMQGGRISGASHDGLGLSGTPIGRPRPQGRSSRRVRSSALWQSG
jgi:hypothetical protein